ncbi:major facilitator superfamily protein [Hirsutella rhossiliensis]|uniref:Major facilitator superfamily domain-containing protein n=1 Tax=Hirsutella rhossiliensis TaxID=111463 RepID=A0A9P8SH72_9HYPO|nr:major facilitator superfamily domain-containing protein [Hirsutella rhossiliensis]KAH0960711.1 major facilitator superfamily domain-containing protein [Hirsutella rhossiliensis]
MAPEGATAEKRQSYAGQPDEDGAKDVLSLGDVDPALDKKMRLVNDAIDEIGWTPYHLKLFFLNGFGYSVDSMILLFQAIVADQAFLEFGKRGYSHALTVAVYCGMLAGAVFWGCTADLLGRKYAFNVTLFLCAVSCIVAGAVTGWPALGGLIALLGFFGGGNLILDTTVFLEFLPGSKQWVLTMLACWWGLGQAVAGLIGWVFLVPKPWNCSDDEAATCSAFKNRGWRYVLFTGGGLVFVLSLLRMAIIRLRETPKYLLSMGRDAELVETLQFLALKYGRPCSLTLGQLEACGPMRPRARNRRRCVLAGAWRHLSGLFSTRVMARSTLMLWLSWTLIGLAYPLFYVFLPEYLKRRGLESGGGKQDVWRNYAVTAACGIPGLTMAAGALATGVFFVAYTQVKSAGEETAMMCLVACLINVYYGTLYAYTAEVLPSAHRATGNGVAVACNRVMGIASALVATFADTATPAPLYVCAALMVAAAVVAALFPLEPYGRRSS